jgi:hypothetical protein
LLEGLLIKLLNICQHCKRDPDLEELVGVLHGPFSLLLEIGTQVNTVQRRAGHSKASVTTDIYGHVMAHSQDAAAENIEEIVKPFTSDLQ